MSGSLLAGVVSVVLLLRACEGPDAQPPAGVDAPADADAEALREDVVEEARALLDELRADAER